MKTVKRREEKDSGGSEDETASAGNLCSQVSVVASLSLFALRANVHFQVSELND